MDHISTVIGGGTPKTKVHEYFEGGSISWLTPADLSGYTNKYISHGKRFITQKGLDNSSAKMMPSGTVLFTSRAPIGYVVIAKNPISTNQGFKSFVLKKGIFPDYVYWWLKGNKDLAQSYASGTTFLELSGAKAKQLPVPIAPINEQKLIVSEIEKQFSRLDEALAALKRIKANLKRYKASVLKAAVEGKLTEEWRRQNSDVEPASELLKQILVERRRKWEEAELEKMKAKGKEPKDDKWKKRYKEPEAIIPIELNNMPENWLTVNLESLCSQIGDVDHKMPKAKENGISYVSTKDFLPNNSIDYQNSKKISEEDYKRLCRKIYPETDDILLSRYGTVGEVRHIKDEEKFQASYSIAIIKPAYNQTSNYIAFVLQTDPLQEQMKKYTRATAQPDLGLAHIRDFEIPFPPREEQDKMMEEVDNKLSIIEEIGGEVNTALKRAERLRQSILKKAFAGNLVSQGTGAVN